MFSKKQLPGWAILLLIAIASTLLSSLLVVGGKHPLEASAVAIVIGLVVRNAVLGRNEAWTKLLLPGIGSADKLLVLGIVLLGASLDFSSLAQNGPKLLLVIVVTMLAGFIVIYQLGRFFKLPQTLSLLLAVGTTICGTSAIAITAPLIKAKEAETSYAVATVALWGLVAIFLYPEIGFLLGVSQFQFGVFAGTAIHSTPQVVGAGYIYSDLSGTTATAVKLVRNCFMAPLAIGISLWFARQNREGSRAESAKPVDVARAFPWFLFAYFVMAGCSTRGYFTKSGIDAFTEAGKFLVLLGMAGVGLNTQFSAFRTVGTRPLLVGFWGTALLALLSAGAIYLAFPMR